MAILPILLGIWMMYHAFMIISFGGDLDTFRIKGSGWTLFGGVVLLGLSFIVLVNPFSAGVAAVVVFAGIGLLVFGVLLCWMSMILRNIHKTAEKEYPR